MGTADEAWRALDREALDAAYNNSAAVADSAQWLDRWRTRSAATRGRPGVRPDIPYGDGPRRAWDFFPAGDGAPVFVFIHGGYWLRNDRSMFSFVADGLATLGVASAVIGYPLTPEVRLTEIVAAVGAAIASVARTTGAGRLVVGGWSAGGHLAALMLERAEVAAAVPISGIFDLEPIAACSMNATIGLDAAEVAALSPVRRAPTGKPAALFVGAGELPELRRQSALWASHTGAPLDLPTGRDHFSILDDLWSAEGPICRTVARLAHG
jgi:arylformamidase